jgi:ribosome maturation factor RimP
VEDPIKAAYILEVSSPGIDRPLMKWVDYQCFAGFEAKIELKIPQDGRKRFQGRIKSNTANGTVILNLEGVEVSFDFNDINNGQLVLTDDLLAAAALQQVDEQE